MELEKGVEPKRKRRYLPQNSPFLAFSWIFRNLQYQIYTVNYSVFIEKEKALP